ncbi:family 1 glycosylhydrolase [Synechococcus sp. GFB01]|uniref:family 1 glycosylhydrolase n=1 Tax=Synechococcus sp. GFB01 TaxID=1662190 RepID=UPI00090826DF|nr:family 1 glycosylhydrolase [Synechococcus sp. GFB01]
MPADFLWGVATSAHQVDGHTHGNHWARFECQPGVIAEGAVSGSAADHWNRLEEDTDLIRDLGANVHRPSLQWSLLEPEPGRWDKAPWEHADLELALLEHAGIEPMLTLPIWLAAGALGCVCGAPSTSRTCRCSMTTSPASGPPAGGIRSWPPAPSRDSCRPRAGRRSPAATPSRCPCRRCRPSGAG